MDDSGAILSQISSLKDMLDRVNEEIEANIQITREIESEVVKCSEIESALAVRESELMKMIFIADFELDGLMAVAADSRTSVKLLDEELCHLRLKRDETIERMKNRREGFTTSCLEFQRTIDKGENEELDNLLSEKKFLEKEIYLLSKKNSDLQNSMLAFVEEIIEDLYSSNSAVVAIHCKIVILPSIVLNTRHDYEMPEHYLWSFIINLLFSPISFQTPVVMTRCQGTYLVT